MNYYMNKTVDFLFPSGNSGIGTVTNEMANGRYLIKIIIPKSMKGEQIDVDEADIVMVHNTEPLHDIRYGKFTQKFEPRRKKPSKPISKRKVKRCRCK